MASENEMAGWARRDFIQSARQACRETEDFERGNTQPLLSALIRLLYDADRLVQTPMKFVEEDLNADTTPPSGLNSVPKELVFQVVFDPLDPESVCAASLRDCLGDIYLSLKAGLRALEKQPNSADAVFWQWKMDYETHWGRNLLDAIRFLFLCAPEAETNGLRNG